MSRILDIGSGLMPDYRATDAIDYQTRSSSNIKQNEQFHINGQILHLGVSKNRVNYLKKYRDSNIHFKWNVDFNSYLPYADNTFNKIVSHSSIIAFGKISAYKEIYRVLKHGVSVEIRSASGVSDNLINKTISVMKKVGFKKIKVLKNIKDTRLFAHETNYFRNDCVYGIK